MLGLTAFEAALEIWRDVDIVEVRAKSIALGDLFIALLEARCAGFELASPRAARLRGSQVSFRHASAAALVEALGRRAVIADFRPPDLMRFGFAPLYLRYVDIWDAADHLAQITARE